MKMRAHVLLPAAALLLCAGSARAATLSVGPGAKYTKIMDAWAAAQPGDVIEVQGGQTYTGTFLFDSDHSGTDKSPITVRGIPVNGQRPILKGIGPGMWDNMVVLLNANHFVMESFEIVGNDNDTDYCLVHKADDVLLRDMVVHDCLHQAGLVSTDTESGSITVEYSDFYHNGNAEYSHQLYMATDQDMYPHATFRLQFSYIHDGVGGNNVATRSERNEIYYNWIEGAYYHELDLIGPDLGLPSRPCDSDVVGNVFVKTSEWRIARIGGDGSGDSMGQFRFANNTMVLADSTTAVLGLQFTVQSVEFYNNVVMAPKAGVKAYTVDDQSGPPAVFYGSSNWIVTGVNGIPEEWAMTTTGADPGFQDAAMHDLRPAKSSPLIGAGTKETSAGDKGVPNPLLLPAFHPPGHALIPIGSAESRTFAGAPSIGAFEPNGSPPGTGEGGVGGAPTISGGGAGNGGAGGNGGSSGNGGNGGSSGGCKCEIGREGGGASAWLSAVLGVGLILARRRRR